jgi:signal transduction histidine kinase
MSARRSEHWDAMPQERTSAARRTDEPVRRTLSRHVSTILLLSLLLVEAGVGAFIIRDLTRSSESVQKMYNGSVQGLLKFGDLQYHAQETRRSTLYALTTSDGNLQVEYAEQSREADRVVTQGIKDYLARARTPQEAEAGRHLADDWQAYLQVRDDVLGRILESSVKEAVQIDLTRGVPQFERVREDLNEIKKIYDDQASLHLATVRALLGASRIRLLTALGLGLLLGSVALWGFQKLRVRSAVQLAKLQMDFVASVSHELRTPIAAILSAAENLRDGLVTKRDDIIQHTTVITDQAAQLTNLVEQVLSFASTAESNQLHPLGNLRIDEVIDDALRSTTSLLQEAGFTLERQIQSGLPPVVGEFSVLSHCLQNLIANAVKYSSGNRWVRVSAGMDERSHQIQIRVHDHGMGIHDSDLPHIFEPFYRSPEVVTARIKGTGLGLSIAKRSAEAFGGTLAVSSQVGVGTVFTVSLPAAGQELAEVQFSQASKLGDRI